MNLKSLTILSFIVFFYSSCVGDQSTEDLKSIIEFDENQTNLLSEIKSIEENCTNNCDSILQTKYEQLDKINFEITKEDESKKTNTLGNKLSVSALKKANAGDFEAAKILIDSAIFIYPNNSHYYFVRGTINHVLNKPFETILKDYNKSISLNPYGEFIFIERARNLH